jgi:hypothetical protein
MKIPTLEEEKTDFILDLYNHKGSRVLVLTKNKGDEDDCLDWLQISMGIVVCYLEGLIEIKDYKYV